jgi:hypothetical protein
LEYLYNTAKISNNNNIKRNHQEKSSKDYETENKNYENNSRNTAKVAAEPADETDGRPKALIFIK